MIARDQALGLWLILSALILPGKTAIAAERAPVAIIYSLGGEASLAANRAAPHPLHLLDRLQIGALVQVGPGSCLELAFLNGLRFELGAGSRVKIGREGVATRSGVVRALPPVPRLPALSPIAAKDRPGRRTAVMDMNELLIEAKSVKGLYPDFGAAALADETFLRFQPIAGATNYRIRIWDAQGEPVFSVDSDSVEVKVPAGTLRSGSVYHWTVRTPEKGNPVACGNARLVTVRAEAAHSREETRRLLALEGPSSLPLLAEVDRGLGLLFEAREDIRAALGATPLDPALLKALAEIEARLEHDEERDWPYSYCF